MDIRDYIKIADAFGSETRNLAELKEGELADRLAAELGWTQDDSEEIEQSVEDTGNDPEEIVQIIKPSADAPEAQTNTPPQPVPDANKDLPPSLRYPPDISAPTQLNTTAPAQPTAPETDQAPQVDTDTAADPDATDPRGETPDREGGDTPAVPSRLRIRQVIAPRIEELLKLANESIIGFKAILEGKSLSEALDPPQRAELQNLLDQLRAAGEKDPEVLEEFGELIARTERALGISSNDSDTTDPDATDPRGDQTNPPAADPDATDPRGDQTNPPAAPQTDTELDADGADSGVDTTDDARAARTNAPQTDAELDADSADNAPQGDALAGRLDTETPSLLDAYNDGGRQAMDNVRDLQQGLERLGFDPNGVDGKYGRGTYAAVQEFQRQNGLTVDGEAGPTTMAKLQELLNAGSATPQADAAAAADVADAGDAGQEPNAAAPQTDAELDADSADSGTPTSRLDTKGETPAPQTDAELDADSADAATPAAPRVSDERGMQSNGSIVNLNVDQFKSSGTYVDIPDRNNPGFVTRVYGPRDNLETFIQNDRRGRGLTIQGGTQQAGTPDAERDSRERGVQTASKDFSMKKFIKESKALDECGTMPMSSQQEGSPVSMNVTLNASGEQNVQELIRMMQLAGAQGAAPVADMHAGPMDKHDDMVHMMRMMDEPEEAMPEEAVEEDWDNSPNEDYRDHKHMTKDLSGGLNREKKAYAKAQDGDNAMAVESIKEQLLKALEETGYKK